MENRNKNKSNVENKMKEIKMDKVVLSAGATGDNLEKAFKLLERISGKKPIKTQSVKRIPSWEVRPKLEVGCKVTLRKAGAEKLLKRLLAAVDNQLKRKQISKNHFSFGIKEYIEIPDFEYQRDIGIMGFNITVDFSRRGYRVKIRKIKQGRLPKKQEVTEKEIEDFMANKYGVEMR